jgi:hypothetical protein
MRCEWPASAMVALSGPPAWCAGITGITGETAGAWPLPVHAWVSAWHDAVVPMALRPRHAAWAPPPDVVAWRAAPRGQGDGHGPAHPDAGPMDTESAEERQGESSEHRPHRDWRTIQRHRLLWRHGTDPGSV